MSQSRPKGSAPSTVGDSTRISTVFVPIGADCERTVL